MVLTSVPCRAGWPFRQAALKEGGGQGWVSGERDGHGLAEEWVGCCPPPKPYLPPHGNETSCPRAGSGQGAEEIKAALYISSGYAKIWENQAP